MFSRKFTLMIMIVCSSLALRLWGSVGQRLFAGINKLLTSNLEKWLRYMAVGVHACLIYPNAMSYLASPRNLKSSE